MTLREFIVWILREYRCCISTSARENRCSLGLEDFTADSIAIINGTKFQRHHSDRVSGKLADRIIFSDRYEGFVCVAELKAGSWRVHGTIEQVMNGFLVAADLLKEVRVNSWYPLVISRSGPKQEDERVMRKDLINFQGGRQRLRHVRCDIELAQIVR